MIIVNPAISILLGIIAGTVTYWYLHMAHKWMNMEGIIDSTGVIGVYIINGIISPIFSCILIAFYTSHPTGKPLFLGVTVGVDGGMSNATFQVKVYLFSLFILELQQVLQY
jgi:ammonia channel protein AmtB